MNEKIKEAQYRFLANLISRKALTFFVGVVGTIALIIHGVVTGGDYKDIAILLAAWTASVSAFASIWCVANHFDKKR